MLSVFINYLKLMNKNYNIIYHHILSFYVLINQLKNKFEIKYIMSKCDKVVINI
jgi:hypothetical protein